MADKTCKTCKQWKPVDKTNLCYKFVSDINEELPIDNAFTIVEISILKTGPDFGCIHWEKKE